MVLTCPLLAPAALHLHPVAWSPPAPPLEGRRGRRAAPAVQVLPPPLAEVSSPQRQGSRVGLPLKLLALLR